MEIIIIIDENNDLSLALPPHSHLSWRYHHRFLDQLYLYKDRTPPWGHDAINTQQFIANLSKFNLGLD